MRGLDNSRIARSGRPLGFLRYHNRRLTELRRRHIARSNSSHCNSRGPFEPATTSPATLPDQGYQVDQLDPEDRLRLSHRSRLSFPASRRRSNRRPRRSRRCPHRWRCSQQDLGALELPRRALTPVQNRPELVALVLGQCDTIAYIHPCLLVLRHGPPAESNGRRESLQKSLHRQAGPVSGLYPPVHAVAPPASGRNRHAGILPRQPTIGSPDGVDARTGGLHPEAAGPPAASNCSLIPPNCRTYSDPRLNRSKSPCRATSRIAQSGAGNRIG